MADVRGDLGAALEGRLTPEQIKLLLDEVLAIKKQAWANCPHCKKKSLVEIPDAKAVTSCLIDLSNQAWGRPGEAAGLDDEKIVFERVVYLTEGVDSPDVQ